MNLKLLRVMAAILAVLFVNPTAVLAAWTPPTTIAQMVEAYNTNAPRPNVVLLFAQTSATGVHYLATDSLGRLHVAEAGSATTYQAMLADLDSLVLSADVLSGTVSQSSVAALNRIATTADVIGGTVSQSSVAALNRIATTADVIGGTVSQSSVAALNRIATTADVIGGTVSQSSVSALNQIAASAAVLSGTLANDTMADMRGNLDTLVDDLKFVRPAEMLGGTTFSQDALLGGTLFIFCGGNVETATGPIAEISVSVPMSSTMVLNVDICGTGTPDHNSVFYPTVFKTGKQASAGNPAVWTSLTLGGAYGVTIYTMPSPDNALPVDKTAIRVNYLRR
jgi:hypothetical protein